MSGAGDVWWQSCQGSGGGDRALGLCQPPRVHYRYQNWYFFLSGLMEPGSPIQKATSCVRFCCVLILQ